MSYADWDEYLAIASRQSQSFAVFNVALGNPLTDTGTYCRRWYAAGAIPNIADYVLKSTVDGGAWDGSDVNNALSMRAWFRSTGGYQAGGSTSEGGMKLICKGDAGGTSTGNGYSLCIGDGIGATGVGGGFQTFGTGLGGGTGSYVFGLTLHMQNGGSSKRVYIRDELGTGVFDNFLISRNRWYRIRMDVIPQGAALDIIKVYMDDSGGGSPGTVITGSENWTLIHTENIFNTSGWFRGVSAAHRMHVQQTGWHSFGGFDPLVDGYSDAVEFLKASV